MAIENVPIEELPSFGRRLMELAKKKGLGAPSRLADALYKQCHDLVEPAARKNKYGKIVKDQKHDIDAITRTVQRHFYEEYAYNIQSNFLLAYSNLFECSLDYLFGISPIKSCDLEVREICEKLHIDEKAALNLIEGYDPDPEVLLYTNFWSEIMSGDLFEKLPLQWTMHRMELLEYNDLEKKIVSIKKAEKSATDSTYRTTMEVRRSALEKMQPSKWNSCEGAYNLLMKYFSDYICLITKKWVDSQHVELEDNYYDNEMEKIKLLQSVLKEGSEPINKN